VKAARPVRWEATRNGTEATPPPRSWPTQHPHHPQPRLRNTRRRQEQAGRPPRPGQSHPAPGQDLPVGNLRTTRPPMRPTPPHPLVGRWPHRPRQHDHVVHLPPRAPRGAWFPREVGDLPAGSSQRPGEAGGSLIREAPGRVASSPDNDGTGQYFQMVRVRLARRKGVREEPVLKPLKEMRQLKSGGYGLGCGAYPCRWRGSRCGQLPELVCGGWQGGHGEGLRRTRGEAAGV
jgi:hypothetical protein